MPISDNERQFVAELLADPKMNRTAAYEKVFRSRGKVASSSAAKLMLKPAILEAIEKEKADRLRRAGLTADDVLRQIYDIATTDTNDLIEWRVGACRYCYGLNHRRQFTAGEYESELEAYRSGKKYESDDHFDSKGGIGFDPRKPPHPDCPECWGEGHGREILKDSRNLSPGARTLYNGVRRSKNGIEVLQRSKDRALELAAKHTGVSKETIALGITGGVTIYVPDNGRDGENGRDKD